MGQLLCIILRQDYSAISDISQGREGSPDNFLNVTVKQHISSKITNNVCKDLAVPFKMYVPPMSS